MKSSAMHLVKYGFIILAILVAPSMGRAATEAVDCKAQVSYLGGNLVYTFSHHETQDYSVVDLNNQILATKKNPYPSEELKVQLIAFYNKLIAQRGVDALNKAKQDCGVNIMDQEKARTAYLRRVLMNPGMSPDAYEIIYSR
jgi:hypothetical protein